MLIEFAALVNFGLLAVAVRNLLGPGWPVREELLLALERTDPALRYHFARKLRAEGRGSRRSGSEVARPIGSASIVQGKIQRHGPRFSVRIKPKQDD